MIFNQRETSSAESATLEILNWDGENPKLKGTNRGPKKINVKDMDPLKGC